MSRPSAPVGDTAWLDNDDVLDDEDVEPTLRVPYYASVAVGEVVGPLPDDPPPRRRSLLVRLRLPLLSCAVAIVFALGWWGGSVLAPQSEPPAAATKLAPMRIMLRKAPRILAPPEEPQPQAQVQKPAPKFFGFLVPTSTASTASATTAYTPKDL